MPGKKKDTALLPSSWKRYWRYSSTTCFAAEENELGWFSVCSEEHESNRCGMTAKSSASNSSQRKPPKIRYLAKGRRGQTQMILLSTLPASGDFRLMDICARHICCCSYPHRLFSMNLFSLPLNLSEFPASTMYEGRVLAFQVPLSQATADRPAKAAGYNCHFQITEVLALLLYYCPSWAMTKQCFAHTNHLNTENSI